jgi:hypothetical protein
MGAPQRCSPEPVSAYLGGEAARRHELHFQGIVAGLDRLKIGKNSEEMENGLNCVNNSNCINNHKMHQFLN